MQLLRFAQIFAEPDEKHGPPKTRKNSKHTNGTNQELPSFMAGRFKMQLSDIVSPIPVIRMFRRQNKCFFNFLSFDVIALADRQ
ncbi:hypothetical protein EJG51_000860 [Undibacterium piscinae]|uniref:Uncharacterized protein n=1 Tax=Undibacterium piscinae TaxID=2495591 RepID=A0A6M4A242_9BURK|nr:hypothetical protein EJG51_000860 [Undibacterium piscinae]